VFVRLGLREVLVCSCGDMSLVNSDIRVVIMTRDSASRIRTLLIFRSILMDSEESGSWLLEILKGAYQ
jgi:hypothetical protein